MCNPNKRRIPLLACFCTTDRSFVIRVMYSPKYHRCDNAANCETKGCSKRRTSDAQDTQCYETLDYLVYRVISLILSCSSATVLESAWGSGSTWTIPNFKGIKPLKEWIEASMMQTYDRADPTDYSRYFEIQATDTALFSPENRRNRPLIIRSMPKRWVLSVCYGNPLYRETLMIDSKVSSN